MTMTADEQHVLVTGGAGYVGSHVSKALSQSGYIPVTYDNLSRGFRWAVKWGPFVEGDLHDIEKLKGVLATYKPVGVIHLAGFAYVGESVEQPDLYYHNNVEGAAALVKAMTTPIPFVFSSTCSIYGNQGEAPLTEALSPRPINPYAQGKREVEIILANAEKNGGGPFVALRYFNASGADPDAEIGEAHDPETHLIPLALSAAAGLTKELTIFGTDHGTPDGSCIRDYVHVADLASAHIKALNYLIGGGSSDHINLANGRGYSVLEVIDAVKRVTGQSVPVKMAGKRAGDPATLIGDARRAQERLNWQPQYSDLDVQIAHAWAWFKDHHNVKDS